MKKIIFCLCLFALLGCGESKNYKYKKGDVVYLKPDSTKGVIDEVDFAGSDYRVVVGYKDDVWSNNSVYVNEETIYAKQN